MNINEPLLAQLSPSWTISIQVPPVGLDVPKLSKNELNRNPLLLGMKSNQKKKLPLRKLLIGQVNGTESSGAENIFLFFSTSILTIILISAYNTGTDKKKKGAFTVRLFFRNRNRFQFCQPFNRARMKRSFNRQNYQVNAAHSVPTWIKFNSIQFHFFQKITALPNF